MRYLRFLLATALFVLLPSIAAADPISIIITAVVSAVATVGVPALGIAGSLIGGLGIIGSFGVRFGIGLALHALSRPSGTPGTAGNVSSASSRGYQVTQSGSALEHQIIYGRVKTGGVRVFDYTTGTNNKFLHRVIAFAGHEVESFDEVYLNDELLTISNGEVTAPSKYAGLVEVWFKMGTANQDASQPLVNRVGKWTSAHRLRGIAYIYVRFEFDDDAYPNGVPNLSAVIKGKKLYDPRTDVTEWSDNPALCMRDYLTSAYGLNEDEASIDDTLVQVAANVCDETSTLSGSTRYTCNGAFLANVTSREMIMSLGTSMGGIVWYAQGKWRMKAAKWTSTVMDLTDDDLRSSVTLQTRHSRRDNYNTIVGTFRGEESSWQITDFPPVSSSAYLTADNDEEITSDLELNFTDNAVEARRIARIALEQHRQQLTHEATWGIRTLQLQVGDNVRITNDRFGWDNKEFEVVNWRFAVSDEFKLHTVMSMRETAESVYDEIDDGATYERDNTELLSPFDVPTIGLSAVASQRLVNEKLSNVITVTVTTGNIDGFVNAVEVQYKKSADSTWIIWGTGDLGNYDLVDLDATDYDIRAIPINTFGVRGAWVTLSNVSSIVVGQPPDTVTGFGADLNGGTLNLFWDPVTNGDLSYYIIRWSLDEAGATYANAVTLVEKVPRPGMTTSVPALPGTYFIRAVNKRGLQSQASATVVVPAATLENFANEDTLTEHTTFTGSKTNVVVDTGELRLDSYSTAPATGTYDFSTYIDTGSARRVRARIDMLVSRQDDGSGLWDDITGDIDSLAGNWDDLTGGTQFADSNVVGYISVTSDDPAGSPVWSPYTRFRSGDYYGRAFRFRIELTTTSADVTPLIEELVARVEYD